MSFPDYRTIYIGLLSRKHKESDGWVDCGKTGAWRGNGYNAQLEGDKYHEFCGTWLNVGREEEKPPFLFCPRCLVKVQVCETNQG